MQIDWIKQNSNSNLIIIALGWGASPEVVENQILPDNYDIAVLYDYKNITQESLQVNISKYENKILVAWSFGVWASEQLFSQEKFSQAIAIAGSPYPINKDYGIPPRAFALTLKSVLNDGVVKFIVRMCGKHLREYLRHHSTRALTDIQEELVTLNTQGQKAYTPSINWDKVIIPEEDVIFPVKSLQKYWQTTTTEIELLASAPHYPFYDKELIICRIKY